MGSSSTIRSYGDIPRTFSKFPLYSLVPVLFAEEIRSYVLDKSFTLAVQLDSCRSYRASDFRLLNKFCRLMYHKIKSRQNGRMAVPEVPFYILQSRVYSDSLCACAGKMEISTRQKKIL